jgi:tryptophan 7-halogenase
MKIKVAVLGVGTAGLTSLSHCLAWFGEDSEIYSISDPNTPILGIGESTTVQIPDNLYRGTGFNILNDGHELDATAKYGVKYVGWREHDFHSLIVPPSQALHFNNFKLKEFCFKRFNQRWKSRFNTIYGKIEGMTQDNDQVTVVVDNIEHKFDYVVDCRGYPEDYSDYYVSDVIPVNHCLVHMIPEKGEWNYTYHVAHRNGWMFGIPLQTRQGWGYLYNDTITSKEDAMSDIAERFNTTVDKLDLREFKFKTYYANKFLDGRIMKNGNRALFFEPLEALSGYFYDNVMKYFTDFIKGKQNEHRVNEALSVYASSIETFIAYAYHGGSTYDSDFWRSAKQKCTEHIESRERFAIYMYTMNNKTPSEKSDNPVFIPFAISNWEDFDKNFGYNYFKNRSNDLS